MKKTCRILLVFVGLIMVVGVATSRARAEGSARPQVRALWVDAFHDGIKTPEQVDRLIQDAVTANLNTLIVQVRRRGDSYYNKSLEPRTEDPVLQPGFDALQYLIEKAHAHQLEVHAWLNTLVAWNNTVPPQDPNHVWNRHGSQVGPEDTWVSYYRTYDPDKQAWSEDLTSSYYLDPGNPQVIDYTVAVYLEVVKNYDVDGIHLDYSRYAGKEWGFNPTSVARYNAEHNTTGLPSPDDPQWQEWRREQVTNLVRKIYLNALAIKPKLKVSSAVITWGDGPVTEADWEKTRSYVDGAQDWRSWLEQGLIDMVMPMNYFRESNSKQQLWYHRWIEWEKNHQYGRQIVIGPGNFMLYIENTLEQIRRAQAPSSKGNYSAGVALFSYGASHLYSSSDFKDSGNLTREPYKYLPDSNDWLFRLLSKEGGYRDPVWNTFIATEPVFPTPVPIPDMPWKSNPVNGYLMGTVSDRLGKPCDHLKITVDGPLVNSSDIPGGGVQIHREVYTDGSGWFGLTELPAGYYQLSIDEESTGSRMINIEVRPGKVSEADFK